MTPRIATSLHFRKWLFAIPVVAVVGWIAWPYYAAYDLAVAVREGEVSTLEARVAWDSVRQGLRGDLNAVLLGKLSADARTGTNSGAKLGAGLAIMLGPAIIDRMIDSYVTPQAIAAAIRASRTDNVSSGTVNVPKTFNETVARSIRLDQVKYAFFSGGPLTFRVEFIPDHNPPLRHPIEFRFQWDGSWKLTRIMLPPDAIDGLSDQRKPRMVLARRQSASWVQVSLAPDQGLKQRTTCHRPCRSRLFQKASSHAISMQAILKTT